MGKKIIKQVRGMNFWAKMSLITLVTLIASVFMFEGWYKPRITQAAVTLVSGGALNGGATNGGNITLTFPGGVQAGDVVILYGGHPYRAGASLGPSTAGYTSIASYNTATTSFGAWYKVMGTTPDTQVVGLGTANASDATAYGAYILRGIDAAVFDQTTTTAGPTASTNPDSPAITTQTAGAWVLALAGSNVTDATPGTITGYSNVNGNTGNDTVDFTTFGATLEKASAGAENPAAWSTWSTGTWYAITIALKPADVTKPTVNSFTVPSTSSSLTITGITFTASDNLGVTGYLINESSTPPLATDIPTTGTPPTSYTAASEGAKTLYAWVKDAAGNVNNVYAGQTCTITLPDTTAPTVDSFTVPATSNSLTISGIVLAASDNIGVTGYLINESATPPAAGEITAGTAPTSYIAASAGAKTLYAWVKDAAGNVSNAFAGQPCTITLPSPLMHTSGNLGTKYGTWGTGYTCKTCHGLSDSNIKGVIGAIDTPIGSRPVVFTELTSLQTTATGTMGNDERSDLTKSDHVCQVCHHQTKYHQYSSSKVGVILTHKNRVDCTGCHLHSNGFKPNGHDVPLLATSVGHTGCASGIGCHQNSNPLASYPTAGDAPDCRSCHAKADPTTANIGCGSCHGLANGTGEPNGTAHPDAAGSHAKHTGLAVCTSCHDVGGTGGNADHGKGNRGANPAIVNLAASMAWNGINSTCAAANCHINVYGAGYVTTPAWGVSATKCQACHAEAIETTGPATGSHAKHNDTNCGDCHTGATNSSTTPGANHINGTIDVNNGYPATAKHAKDTYTGTCSTASCHDNGKGTPATTPVWGSSVPACTACHALIPADNSHNKHVTTTTYKKALCGDCHTGYVQGTTAAANHLNTTVEINVGGYTSPKAKGSAVGSCATAYCHSSGQSANGLSATPVYATTAPTWGGTAACGSCHATDTLATGSHAKHLTGITPDTNCGNCHSGATLAAYAATSHVDGSIDVGAGTYTAAGAPGNGYGTCSTASCHDNGTGTAVTTPQWGNSATACAACHAASPATGSHSRHLSTTLRQGTLSISCGDCHDGAVAGSNAGTQHLDGTVDMISGSGYPTNITKHAAGSYAGTCSTVYCHSNGSTAARTITYQPVNWNTAQLDCEGCHPTSGLTAGHAAHIGSLLTDRKSTLAYTTYSANVSAGTAYKFGCANCHPVTLANHINGSVDVDVITTANSGTLKGKNPGTASYDMANTKKCANVYCHSNGYAANPVYAQSPAWTGTFSGDKCAGCHGNSPDTTIAGSKAHKVHVVGIHYKDLFSGSIGKMQVAAAKGGAINAAHGTNSRSTTLNCNICHNDTMQTSANDNNTVCIECHTAGNLKNPATLIADTAFHVNGQVNIRFAGSKVVSKAQLHDRSFVNYTAVSEGGMKRNNGLYKNYTSAYDHSTTNLFSTASFAGGNCSNVTCHSGKPVKWTDTISCGNCHTRL